MGIMLLGCLTGILRYGDSGEVMTMRIGKTGAWLAGILVLGTVLLGGVKVFAHCDTIDGPVVAAARKALESGNVDLVLIWVQERNESEIREAFRNTLEVRGLSPKARELADNYFFETLVRIHRAGEGAPYTGLKPAGGEPDPAIEAADHALTVGTLDPVLKLLADRISESVNLHFRSALERRNYKVDDIHSGREYVHSYVLFIHLVEGIYNAAGGSAHGGEAVPETHGH